MSTRSTRTASVTDMSARSTREPAAESVSERARLAIRVNDARARLQKQLSVDIAERASLAKAAEEAVEDASRQVSALRAQGMSSQVRVCRWALQTAHAWRSQRIALLRLREAHLSTALEEVTAYSRRFWSDAPGQPAPSLDADEAERIESADAVQFEPDDLVGMHEDVSDASRLEARLGALRDKAQAALDEGLSSARLKSKESRRRQIVTLLRSQDGSGRVGAREPLWIGDEVYCEAEDAATSAEVERLLFADVGAEKPLVERWRRRVARAADSHADDEHSASNEHDGAAAESSRGGQPSAEVLSPAHVVLPGIMRFAERMCSDGGLPPAYRPMAAHCVGRVLLPTVEADLLRRTVRTYAAEDAQLAAQQRRMRLLSPAELEVEEYVGCEAGSGRPDLRPLSAALEALGALSYTQLPVDFALGIKAAIAAVTAHCSSVALSREGAVSSEGAIGADVLVPMMVQHAAKPTRLPTFSQPTPPLTHAQPSIALARRSHSRQPAPGLACGACAAAARLLATAARKGAPRARCGPLGAWVLLVHVRGRRRACAVRRRVGAPGRRA